MVARSLSCRHSDSTCVGVGGYGTVGGWVLSVGGGSGQGVGVWPCGWAGSDLRGGGSGPGGRLHSKVWTDTHMNATGF